MEGIYIIISFALGYMLAQFLKVLAVFFRQRGKVTLKDILATFMKSGGMPSGHTASFIAASTCLGWMKGFASTEFAITICMAAIIIYDAVNVRYAVGEQGKILNKISAKEKVGKELKIVEGHTIPQVIMGGILGFVIGTVMYLYVVKGGIF